MPSGTRKRFEQCLHRIQLHARVVFRSTKCWHRKQDQIAEVVGLCWKWTRELARKKKPWWKWVSRLATYAAKAVRSGRRVVGQMKAKDVMNEITQAKKGFVVGKLPDYSTDSTNPLQEALTDNTQTPPDEQAIFRLSFPVWLNRYRERDQKIALAMMEGHRTKDISAMFDVSQGRISQMRQQFYRDWSSL